MTETAATCTCRQLLPPRRPLPEHAAEAASQLAERAATGAGAISCLSQDAVHGSKELRDLAARLVARAATSTGHEPASLTCRTLALDGQLSLKTVADAVPALRAAGISDGAIHELLQ